MQTERNTDLNYPAEVEKYLRKFGSDVWEPETSPADKRFNNIAVIPAIMEYDNIKNLLLSLSALESEYLGETLFLFVINNNVEADVETKKNNQDTIEYLRSIIKGNANDSTAGLIIKASLNIALIDASSENKELPLKESGVGLARKTGMDAALRLFDYTNPAKKLLICLDADCIVEKNYLTEIVKQFNKNNYSAGYVRFNHVLPDNEEEKRAIICYEIFLRYYVLGLKYSRSPYAFHTIGSTIICDHHSYIKAGGMNKRKAAEDFYFMEKLSKNYSINQINGTCIYPSGRKSWRVPFGTGQRVSRFLNKTHEEYMHYDPATFEILKKWLTVLHNDKVMTGKEYLDSAESISNLLYQFLIENNFQTEWDKILHNSVKDVQIHRQKLFWFDGFRTLKLIHYLRDNGFPQQNMFPALDRLFEMTETKYDFKADDVIPGIEIQIQYLELLRKLA